MTLHPEGKTGVAILPSRHEEMRRALREVTSTFREGTPLNDLTGLVAARLGRTIFPEGLSIPGSVTTIKLDLETRGELVRIPAAKPQRLLRG